MAQFSSDGIQRFEISLNPQFCEDVWTPSNVDVSPIGDKNVYRPGGQVEGTVHIDVGLQPLKFGGDKENAYKSPKEDVYSIDLKPLQGFLYVGFNNGDSAGPPGHDLMLAEKPTKINVAEKDYIILNRQELLGGRQGDSRFLPPGEHQFPFKFDIPTDIPSSFDGAFGFIDYWMEAVIDQTPFGLGIRRWRRDIIIHGFFDFPADSTDLFPVEHTQKEEALDCCRKSGSYGYTMVLPKRRYSSEEIVSPNFALNNQTSYVSEASVKIIREVTYTAGYGVMKARHLIEEASVVVNPQSSFQWNSRLLLRNHLVPSKTCPNINVTYQLQFRYGLTVCQGCSHLDLTTKIIMFPFTEDCPSQSPPIMTEPRTYVHPPMDLTASQVPGAEGVTVGPPYSEKGGKPLNPGYRPQAEATAPPPVTHQPYPTAPPAVGINERAPPPSYSEVCEMEYQSNAPDSSHPVSESPPEAEPQEDAKLTD